MEKAIREFLELGDLVLVCKNYRYSAHDGLVVCFISDSSQSESIADSFDTCNGDGEYEVWGLDDYWFPVAFGTTIAEAMHRLNLKLERLRDSWTHITFGMVEIGKLKIAPQNGVVCLVKTMGELKEAYSAWYEGTPKVAFFKQPVKRQTLREINNVHCNE